MYRNRHNIKKFLANNPDIARIDVIEARGSAPRDAGTWMLVGRSETFRTIGGGELENMAVDKARALVTGNDRELTSMQVPLGPEIGQCCGGSVTLTVRLLDDQDKLACTKAVEKELTALPHVFIFGAGHVGNALCRALALLPVNPVLIDTRLNELRAAPEGVETRHSALPEAEVRKAPAGSAFVILTHDHALDFLIAREVLGRKDAAFVGMIGSKTKRATFKNWLARENGSDAGIERLACPIGNTNLDDKRPEVIAALATAEILEHLHWEAPAAETLRDQIHLNQ